MSETLSGFKLLRSSGVPRLDAESDGLARGPRIFANVAIAVAAFMAVLDGTIANIALPTIAHDLRIDAASSIWVVNAFQLAICMALLPFSALGDLIGFRRIYLPGIVLFTIGSLWCALSHTLPSLILARVVQGFGAAGILSVGPAIYRAVYPAALLGRGLATNALIIATGSAAGPTLGGLLLAVAPWPWIFAINVPLGVVAIVLASRAIPMTAGRAERLDGPSALASALASGGLILGLDAIVRRFPATSSAPLLGLGAAAAVFFVLRQARIPNPMIALPIFRNKRFTLAILTSLTAFIAQGLAFTALPFFLRESFRASPPVAGLLLSAWPLAIMWTAPLSGRLSDRFPAAVLSTAGLSVLGAGLAILATLGPQSSPIVVVLGNVVCGLGFGFFQAPNNREMLKSVPRERTGNASGMLALMRILGQTLGATLVALLLGQVIDGEVAGAFDLPLHEALALAAAIAWTAGLVSSTRLALSAPRPAVRRVYLGTEPNDGVVAEAKRLTLDSAAALLQADPRAIAVELGAGKRAESGVAAWRRRT